MVEEKLSLWGARQCLKEGQAVIVVNAGGIVRIVEGPCDKEKNQQWLEKRFEEVQKEHSKSSLHVRIQMIEN